MTGVDLAIKRSLLWRPESPPPDFVVEVDGRMRRFPADALVVCLDETGNESFSDPNYPVFGLAGIACRAWQYDSVVERPWRLVERHFDDAQLPLHAADLRPNGSTSHEQMEAINGFFREGSFRRLSVVLLEGSMQLDGDPLHIAYRSLLDQVLAHAQQLRTTSIVFIVEESQRSLTLLNDYMLRYTFMRTLGDEAPLAAFSALKSSRVAGVNVADFVAHTAGGSALSHSRGRPGYRRQDFKVVFPGQPRSTNITVNRVYPKGDAEP